MSVRNTPNVLISRSVPPLFHARIIAYSCIHLYVIIYPVTGSLPCQWCYDQSATFQ